MSYGPNWNNANRVMPDSGKRKVNTSLYGTMRFDVEHTPADKAEALVTALIEHRSAAFPPSPPRPRTHTSLHSTSTAVIYKCAVDLHVLGPRPFVRVHACCLGGV
jgi:hypothetical protein